MCGIAGWYDSQRSPGKRRLLKDMLDLLIHRGPDDEGMYLDGPAALGIRRLSIVDVAGGHQPISSEDGNVWVVLNGEIYNFPELRKELELKGHVFTTRSDTEVIAHGYEQWGDECVARLNGIFGLAIWDARKNRLVIARDPFGVKPLYYFSNGNRTVWASEIKALLADPEIPREVDLEALDLFLTFRFVPSPFTMFSGIRKLPPGHLLISDEQGSRIERYSRKGIADFGRMTEADWTCLLEDQLALAVKRQMMSDVPIGALLSGGVDSGAVVAIMSGLTRQPVRTFTVGFADGNDVNELEEARQTAALFETEHREVLLTSLDYQRLLEKMIWHLDEPIATTSALAMYSVCQLARQHVTVVLTGQGADEPFAGYPRYLGERYGAFYRCLPAAMRNHLVRPIIEQLPRNERLKRAARSLGTSNVTARFAQVYALFSDAQRAALWRPGVRRDGGFHGAEAVIDYWRRDVQELDPLVQMTYVDARLWLSDDLLTYGDKMSMAASVEARVPFLDVDYMRVVEALPAHLRIRGRTQKYIHKKVIAKWLPQEVIQRPKRGFDTPIDRWFRSELSGFVRDTLLGQDAACPQFFHRQAIDELLGEHISGRQDNRRQLFSLLVFELWHRQFISSARAKPTMELSFQAA